MANTSTNTGVDASVPAADSVVPVVGAGRIASVGSASLMAFMVSVGSVSFSVTVPTPGSVNLISLVSLSGSMVLVTSVSIAASVCTEGSV